MLVRGSSLVSLASRAALLAAIGFVVLGGCAQGQLAAKGKGALTADGDAGDGDAAVDDDASADDDGGKKKDSGVATGDSSGNEPDADEPDAAVADSAAPGDSGGGSSKCQTTTCKQDFDCLVALCFTSKCVNNYCT